MAQSLEEIKASFDPPTHKVEDGVRIELTAEEVDAMLDEWSANVRNQQLEQETNGWLYSRLKELNLRLYKILVKRKSCGETFILKV